MLRIGWNTIAKEKGKAVYSAVHKRMRGAAPGAAVRAAAGGGHKAARQREARRESAPRGLGGTWGHPRRRWRSGRSTHWPCCLP